MFKFLLSLKDIISNNEIDTIEVESEGFLDIQSEDFLSLMDNLSEGAIF
jgi:hypothetical protein